MDAGQTAEYTHGLDAARCLEDPAPWARGSRADPEQCRSTADGRRLRVVQWNLERGTELPRIVAALRRLDADVLVLQELDARCRRSDNIDVAAALAAELRLNGYFFAEFEELDHPCRSAHNAAGPAAVHGNAILSRFPVRRPTVTRHAAGLDWAAAGLGLQEPRRGWRGALACDVLVPPALLGPDGAAGGTEEGLVPVTCVCLHLEVFCGALTRVAQFADAVEVAEAAHRRHRAAGRAGHVVIAGDLNTMAHGVVRLSPKYACDRMRWLLWGETEGEWFHRAVLHGDPDALRRWPWGIDAGVARRLHGARALGLDDPFDVYHDVTLNHPTYRGLVQGKLDWVLPSASLAVVGHGMGNLAYRASDHRLLCCDLAAASPGAPARPGPRWHSTWRQLWRYVVCSAVVLLPLLLLAWCAGVW